jgi:fido (protein-threonine AMPylation protein)
MGELRTRMGGLPSPDEAAGVWREIWFQEAHNSTALEGNTLVFRQVEKLLAEGRAVGDKELKDYLEVQGYAEAAQCVYGQGFGARSRLSGDLITLHEVREIHHKAMDKVWSVAPHPHASADERPGNFRRHDIEPFVGGMRPPEWPTVPSLTHDWVAQASLIGKGLNFDDNLLPGLQLSSRPLLEEVAAAHAAFERIHPFIDGNGRCGRLLTNLTLARLGYPPAIIYVRQRPRYLDALCRADAGDPGPLGEMMARAVTDNLVRFVIPAVAGPMRLVPLAALETKEATHMALRLAALRGRLQAQQGTDGVWRSTRKWVDEYLARRYRRDKGAGAQTAD